MNKGRALFLFVGLCFASSTTALACSPPDYDTSWDIARVSSAVPAKVAPIGAVQLKVESPDYKKMADAIFNVGKINLRVKQVLDGSFTDSNVLLNVTNVDNCNSSFEPQFGDFFITVVPMRNGNGESVADRNGRQEFSSIFYKGEVPPDADTPKFAEYSLTTRYSFYDPQKLACFYKQGDDYTKWSADVWRRCVRPGEYLSLDCEMHKAGKLICVQDDLGSTRPPELRRGYSFWDHHYKSILVTLLVLTTLLGTGYFSLRKRLRRA